MGLKCYLARRRLAATSSSETLPNWAAEHLATCAKCAAEAKAYARLRVLLAGEREQSGAPEWEVLRSRLAERASATGVRLRLLPVGAAAFAMAVLAFGFVLWPQARPARHQPVKPVVVADAECQVAPASDAAQPARVTPASEPRQPDIGTNQPKATSSPRVIIEPRSNRIQRLRRYKPWKLTAQAPTPERQTQSAKQCPPPTAGNDDAATQPPSEVAVTNATAGDVDRNGGSSYVIDMVSMDNSEYAPL